jgi:hypothetical protein
VAILLMAAYMICVLDAEKGVPDFWLIAMKNNEVLSEEVSYLSTNILFNLVLSD